MTISCDAIKIAMRQNKEGYVISFSVTPQEMHSDLADALIPSYWRLTLTPMNEDGNFPRDGSNLGTTHNKPLTATQAEMEPPTDTPVRARKSWQDMSPAQQAGIL